ncbi:MAG TPA: LysR family transcriptional regulator [Acidimicrobiales bacterium]|nr:LysR family transcriptional regulator [Acidimicrobiales bacterium]
MTLTQLEAFVLVARLGSVKAAASVLGVSEPAVSGALAALRQHLDDPLVVRTGGGMELTPGGQRVLPIASQMVNLAADATDAVRRAQGAPDLLRVVATSTVAEYVARPLITAFTQRHGPVEATLGVTTATEMPALLMERLADVGLGPRLGGLDSHPMLRHRLVVVAGPEHRLARAERVEPADVAHQDWLVDASGADPATETGILLAHLRVPDARVRVFPNLDAAWTAAAAGEGVAPGIAHLVAEDVDHGRLVILPVEGTPLDLLWYANTLPPDRRSRSATKLRRFIDTPDAMHAMHRADASVPVARFRPPVYVTLWS